MFVNRFNLDFNCDIGHEDIVDNEKAIQLLECVSSVNIACGLHSGSPLLIKKAIENCKFKNKVIGALIGLPASVTDPLSLTFEEVEAIVLYQLGAISAFAQAYSLNIEHVRTHGIMYDFAAKDKDFALSIARAVKKYNEWFVYYGAATEVLDVVASELNINIAREFIVKNRDSLVELKDKIENRVIDTVHFSTNTGDVLELLNEAKNLVSPTPVNYNCVVDSGWV